MEGRWAAIGNHITKLSYIATTAEFARQKRIRMPRRRDLAIHTRGGIPETVNGIRSPDPLRIAPKKLLFDINGYI